MRNLFELLQRVATVDEEVFSLPFENTNNAQEKMPRGAQCKGHVWLCNSICNAACHSNDAPLTVLSHTDGLKNIGSIDLGLCELFLPVSRQPDSPQRPTLGQHKLGVKHVKSSRYPLSGRADLNATSKSDPQKVYIFFFFVFLYTDNSSSLVTYNLLLSLLELSCVLSHSDLWILGNPAILVAVFSPFL